MCSNEEGDRGNRGSRWHAGGLVAGQQVDTMAEGGVGQTKKLVPAMGADRKLVLIRKTWGQVMRCKL